MTDEDAVCGAERRVPFPVALSLWNICRRDVFNVVVICHEEPRHPPTEHVGLLLDMGELRW